MNVLFFISITLFLILCLLICLVVLVQESKSLGLGSSFGGDSSSSFFGASTADVLKKFTAYLTAIFIGSCVMLSLWTSVMERKRVAPIKKQPVEQVETQSHD
ncbi:preprotein translocase subunit SecG [Candidatus Aerophobetes bacterium]|uniref:Protein-export membrane protein SecG n=1 Tax=Aerophobetes bacterium TaxID=2030807 RepID=A0A2A4X9C2_UNCAE|nr:MAG: preprotein translocase subunit SecG [Candidatus Aerophobetes bacterium]